VPAEFEKSIFIEADAGQGMVAIRSFVPDHTWDEAIADYLGHAQCALR
jgi:uncharacterized membrane protein